MATVEDYTIGCICALAIEAVALRAFLDEEHPCPEIPSTHAATQDRNVYTTGAIGGHKILIGTLPFGKYGVSQATGVIENMIRSFPNLRCCLMVGIGGGAPSSKHDIRLGDIVVSASSGRSGGILQYDHGKATQGEPFRINQHLNEPPTILLAAIGKLIQDYDLDEHPLHNMVDKVLTQRPRLKTYRRPKGSNDRLYQSAVIHPIDARGDCEQVCGTGASELVERPARAAGAGVAEIHYGIIASGSSLMKDASIRDRLSEEEAVLCFEMEAAGLMNRFPCLVIRGICDYSDSHKNDDWQKHAAMMAAAYTKEVLRVLMPGTVKSTVERLSEKLNEKLGDIDERVQELATRQQNLQDSDMRKRLLDWLPSRDYSGRQNALQSEFQSGTGQWFLDTATFHEWMHQQGSILFCPGIPGAGKTYIASLVVNYLQRLHPFHPTPALAYIYCEYTQELTREVLLGSLLEQLARMLPCLPTGLIDLYESHRDNRTQASVNELQMVLYDIALSFERCFIVVDGLDECTDEDGMRNFLFETLAKLRQQSRANVLTMSRDIHHIRDHFIVDGCLEIEIKALDHDIGMFLENRIPRVLPLLADDFDLCQRIKTVIMAGAGGMFLLAMLHVNSLKGKYNAKAIDDALADIRSGGNSLMGAYDKTMKMIESQDEGYRKLAKHTLSWVAFSSTPLTVQELQHALAIEPAENSLNVKNITKLDVVLSTCAGLVTLQGGRHARSTVHLVHETTQEYFDKTQRWFGDVKPRLARLSLTYLTFRDFESGPCKSKHGQGVGFRKGRYPVHARIAFPRSAHVGELASREAQHPFYVYLRKAFPRYIEGNHENVKVKAMLEKFFLHEPYVQAYMQAQPHMRWYFADSTPLHLAIFYRISSLVPLLMHRYGNRPNGQGLSPLHVAVSAELYDGIASLISLPELNINAVSPWKGTALSYASETGDVKSVKMLLARDDIDRNLANEHGRTPLSYALGNGRLEIVKLLLEWSGTDCTSPDHRGIIPLSYAALGACEGCIKVLLERPEVHINTVIGDRITILHWAIEKGRLSMVEYLLGQSDVDVNVADRLGRTPLIWCMVHGQIQAANLLLSREDLKLNLVDKNGKSFVIWAARFGSPCLSENLLDKLGAQIFAKDNDSCTALDYAARWKHWSIVESLLMRHRTKIRIKHWFHNTALCHAIGYGSKHTISLLLRNVALEQNWWYIDALGRSMENDSLEAFTVLKITLGLWMRNNPQWFTHCLRRAAEHGDGPVLAYMLKKLHYLSAGLGHFGVVLFPSDRTWDDIAIQTIVLELPVEQLNVRDRLGQTALHAAAKRGDIATTRVLSMLGADKGARDMNGRTPLTCAIRGQRFSKAVGLILDCAVHSQPRDGT